MAGPPLQSAFPSSPLLDPTTGDLSAAWRGLLNSLYIRTGAANGVSTGGLVTTLSEETNARQNADTAEATTRAAADTAEATARTAADVHLAATTLPLTGGALSGPLSGPAGLFGVVGTGGSGGPTWTAGAAVPTAAAPIGSLYSCTAGALGARLYVSGGGGAWHAVAGV